MNANTPLDTTTASPFGASSGGFARLREATKEAEIDKALQVLEESATDDAFAGMTPKERRLAERQLRRLKGKMEDYPHLMAIKPTEGYLFRSDYFHVDRGVACVLGFFHDDAAKDDFGAFWGINRIPDGLGDGVSVVVLEQVRRMGQQWIDDKTGDSERLNKLDAGENDATLSARTKRKAAKVLSDVEIATDELADGASYLHVHNRLLVRAGSLDALDDALEKVARLYVDRFGTLNVAAYPGEQRAELSGLMRKMDKKRGSGQHFTSVEFAGSHSLVTNGLNDPSGEYVGSMKGDVNNSAVLFDVNDYSHHVVVADSSMNDYLGRAHVPDMWGSKISQSALLNNGRVVHLVLDGADLDRLGPALEGITTRLDMSTGDINMLEMFGDVEDEQAIFSAHIEKLVLMTEQVYEATDMDRSIIRGTLADTLTTFYVDKNMWVFNAPENRSRLRIVGIPHNQVPRLQDLVTSFQTGYRALESREARDPEMLHAYNVLQKVYMNLLNTQGDLFNTHTSERIDGVGQARRVIYDFSKLLHRGKGVAMAQLVNTIGFAVDNLSLGDTLVIHGTEHIDDAVKKYMQSQLDRLFTRGGRVAYLYNSAEKMLLDSAFNRFDDANWTVLGPMTDTTVAAYQKKLGRDIPPDLEHLITQRGESLAYLRRGVTNVVFHLDLALGVNPARAAQREAIAETQRRQKESARPAATPKGYVTQEQHNETRAPKALPGITPLGRPASLQPQRRMVPTR
ncbi:MULTISPECIES: hypothetical protein [unclassified Microbacterium]|uniref:hypothetical protein n=1 Tax=unclassified Microbacterium TaxID=2609290 RepID=UPI002882F457|nr:MULTISPECIES: hypothetical protein [unclassified Microbacterium]